MTEDSPVLGVLQPEVAVTCQNNLQCPLLELATRDEHSGQKSIAFCAVRDHQQFTEDNTSKVVKQYEERIPADCPLHLRIPRPES